MRLNLVDIEEFTALVKHCAGKVSLITAEGDRLIANGVLTARIGLASFCAVAQSQDVSIECEKPEDQSQIEQFIALYQSN